MEEYDFRCPECDSRHCVGGCRRTDTAFYFVGYGWYEPDEAPELPPGWVWSERQWDGAMQRKLAKLQITMPFQHDSQYRHERKDHSQ
jgi:hypothetical protein